MPKIEICNNPSGQESQFAGTLIKLAARKRTEQRNIMIVLVLTLGKIVVKITDKTIPKQSPTPNIIMLCSIEIPTCSAAKLCPKYVPSPIQADKMKKILGILNDL